MPESVTSVFTEPADFAAAMAREGCRCLVITGQGQFRARLTWVALHSLRLAAGEEHLSRIAFVTVPDQMTLVALPSRTPPSPMWGGLAMQAGEIITLGPGSCAHMRTDGPCRWSTILVPVRELTRYGHALVGGTFAVPCGTQRWQTPRAAGRHLRHLHAAAIHAVEFRQGEFIGPEAAHGLDQQILGALIECLSAGSIAEETPVTCRCHDMMVRFEALLERQHDNNPPITEIAAELGVPQLVLRRDCQTHLGMSSASYVRLRRMQRVNPARRSDA